MGARKGILALVVTSALALTPAPAAVAGELRTIDVPSDGNVDPAQVRFNGADHPKALKASVLLPDGFDPAKRYPVLYLLHGAGESHTTWVRKTKADTVVKDLQAIVVMPEAATGFYANWWNEGRRGGPGWERYFLDEFIPAIEARFPIRPGRRWHAVAGFSMGGYGSAYLASQRPDYFGASGPMSGFLAPRRPEMPIAFDSATGQSYAALFGPPDGFYVAGHDPVRLAENLRHTRLFVITGNGVPDPRVTAPAPPSIVSGGIGEADLMLHNQDFAAATRAAGAEVTFTVMLGIHDHPYWTEHLRRLLKWDPFVPVPEAPERWSYTTVATHGRAWELTYAFATPPETLQTLERRAGSYAAQGSGTVELCDRDGRGVVAALPFEDAALGRSLAARITERRRSAISRTGRVRVELHATEPASVRLEGALVRGRRSVALRRPAAVALAAGETRTATLTVPPRARTLLRGRGTRSVRVVARHGTCPGGRWTTARQGLAG